MSELTDLDRLQSALVQLCCAPTAADELARLQTEYARAMTPDCGSLLAHADAAGITLTALLVREARLDRLLGDPDLRREHALDPSGFRSEFEDYIATVAPKHANTPDEAQAFRDYMDLLG